MDVSSWKEVCSFSLSHEDYPGHITFSLNPEASAVLQLHGYHLWVSEGNNAIVRSSATLSRWGGSRYGSEMPSEPFGRGLCLSVRPQKPACGVISGKEATLGAPAEETQPDFLSAFAWASFHCQINKLN